MRATIKQWQKWQKEENRNQKNGRNASLYRGNDLETIKEHLRKPLPMGHVHQSRPSE